MYLIGYNEKGQRVKNIKINIWIRLRPVQNKIGTATTYYTATIASNGQVANAFTVSYAALRYNK